MQNTRRPARAAATAASTAPVLPPTIRTSVSAITGIETMRRSVDQMDCRFKAGGHMPGTPYGADNRNVSRQGAKNAKAQWLICLGCGHAAPCNPRNPWSSAPWIATTIPLRLPFREHGVVLSPRYPAILAGLQMLHAFSVILFVGRRASPRRAPGCTAEPWVWQSCWQ